MVSNLHESQLRLVVIYWIISGLSINNKLDLCYLPQQIFENKEVTFLHIRCFNSLQKLTSHQANPVTVIPQGLSLLLTTLHRYILYYLPTILVSYSLSLPSSRFSQAKQRKTLTESLWKCIQTRKLPFPFLEGPS